MLQLQQIQESEADYAEFLHLPRRKFTDFSQFRFFLLYFIVIAFVSWNFFNIIYFFRSCQKGNTR